MRGRGEPGRLARGRLYAVQALAVFPLSGLGESSSKVEYQRAHYGGAGADDGEIDFQNTGEGVSDPDPGVVVGEDLPGVGGADDADGAGDEAEAHEEIERDFGAEFEPGFPEEEDGEGGADEVGYYREDCCWLVMIVFS